jgi:2-polyprenyl-3-methyl-5-hydroxy-6-metoxy-1,4-benzoquinol methylase
MAEAMSLSKPVIATAYSANCEFMSNDDGLLIPFELVSTKGNPTYPYDSYWAAPSTDLAAEAMRKVFADKVFAQDMGRKALIAQEQRASVQHTSEFMLSRITAITSQLELPEQKELAVPRGSLSNLTSGRAMAEVDLRTLVNASDALAHSPVDLNAVKSSNFLVQLGRKFMARISAPFEQHERLRHQSHVAVSSGLVDELNHFATKSMNKYSEFENQLDSLTNVLRAHKAIAEDLGKRLDQVNLKADQIRSQLRALPYLKDPKIFDLQRGSGWTIGFDNRVAESTPHHLVNVFRPSESELISSLRQYAKFLPANGQGIDLGCGRGEMLHVMRECGLSPFGVDSDQACIDQCLKAGFRAKNTDISSFLRNESAESSEVLTAIHVIEHVVYEDLLQWLRDAYRILKSDGVLILETPNPHAVDALKAFWVDPTHVRPYYPESLLIALQEVGFSRAHVEVQGNQIKAQDRLEFAGSYSIIAQK